MFVAIGGIAHLQGVDDLRLEIGIATVRIECIGDIYKRVELSWSRTMNTLAIAQAEGLIFGEGIRKAGIGK